MTDKTPSMFDVPPGTRVKTPFSPTLEEDFIGLRINAPSTIEFHSGNVQARREAFAYIPISLTYRFNLTYVVKFDHLEMNMVVLAVNAQSGQSYSSILEQRDLAPPPPLPADVPRARLERFFSTRYLTFNLAEILPIPPVEAVYHVHLSLETYQSNQVALSLKKAWG